MDGLTTIHLSSFSCYLPITCAPVYVPATAGTASVTYTDHAASHSRPLLAPFPPRELPFPCIHMTKSYSIFKTQASHPTPSPAPPSLLQYSPSFLCAPLILWASPCHRSTSHYSIIMRVCTCLLCQLGMVDESEAHRVQKAESEACYPHPGGQIEHTHSR